MTRYFKLLGVQLRASLQISLQYRVDFLIGAFMALFWMAWNLGPMLVIWTRRPSVAGWTLPEALLVTAWFMLLKAVLEGAVQPSLLAVVEHIRKGTLDFVLLKPADAQFLVSTQKFEMNQIVDALGAVGLAVYAFLAMGKTPHLADVAVALLLTLASAGLLYALSIFVVSAAFWVVRLDNLIYLFNSIFDAARWPVQVFRGLMRWVFTFIVPLALMTTFPAEAMLGRLPLPVLAWSVVGAGAFGWLSRRVWLSSIARYTSASS
jgi:ABC-2 type transport system permease protein